MSLCDRCYDPGHCCRFFTLSHHELRGDVGLPPITSLEAMAILATVQQPDAMMPGVPFMPLYRKEKGGWYFWCPNLMRDGRCADYENRPRTCRSYPPGIDGGCIHGGFEAEGYSEDELKDRLSGSFVLDSDDCSWLATPEPNLEKWSDGEPKLKATAD